MNHLIDFYVAEMLPSKAPSTQVQQGYLLQQLRRELGPLQLAMLTPMCLRQWRDQLLTRHKPGTARRYLESFSAVLTFGHEDVEWLDEHPMRKVRLPPMSPGRVRFLSDDERERLLAACQTSHSPWLYTFVVLGLYTGCRKSEIRCLTWAQVDLDKGCLRLTQTKNGETRVVPLVGLALELVRQLQHVRRPNVSWVFGRLDGTQPVDFDTAWNRARARAGLQDFHYHDLRHTAASYLAMSGASLLEIANILGHKTMQMVKRYSHLSDTHTMGVMQRMVTTMMPEDPPPQRSPTDGTTEPSRDCRDA